MLQDQMEALKIQSGDALVREIAFLTAEGFLSFHPNHPISYKLEQITKIYKKNPPLDKCLTDVILEFCHKEITEIADSL